MESETAELITTETLKCLREMGVDPREWAIEFARQLGASRKEISDQEIQRSFQEAFNNTLMKSLKDDPEPSSEQLSQMVISLRRAAPTLKEVLMKQAKKLPTKAGGRPRALAANSAEAKLCLMISNKLRDYVPKGQAIHNAAVRFGVSDWTARRAWNRFLATNRTTKTRKGRDNVGSRT
jgi:hypothetical protein